MSTASLMSQRNDSRGDSLGVIEVVAQGIEVGDPAEREDPFGWCGECGHLVAFCCR